jgi:hypothetical protein
VKGILTFPDASQDIPGSYSRSSYLKKKVYLSSKRTTSIKLIDLWIDTVNIFRGSVFEVYPPLFFPLKFSVGQHFLSTSLSFYFFVAHKDKNLSKFRPYMEFLL